MTSWKTRSRNPAYIQLPHSSTSNNIQNILKDEKIVQVDEDHVHTQETKQNIKSSSKLETGKQSSSVKEKKAFQLLPLEILDLLLSFLKPEDILMLRNCLPRVQHCPRFKRLVNKTSWFSRVNNFIIRQEDQFGHYF